MDGCNKYISLSLSFLPTRCYDAAIPNQHHTQSKHTHLFFLLLLNFPLSFSLLLSCSPSIRSSGRVEQKSIQSFTDHSCMRRERDRGGKTISQLCFPPSSLLSALSFSLYLNSLFPTTRGMEARSNFPLFSSYIDWCKIVVGVIPGWSADASSVFFFFFWQENGPSKENC